MKKSKKTLFLLTVTFILTLLIGTASVSASTKTINLPLNKEYKQDNLNAIKKAEKIYHKISIPKTGYIAIEGYHFFPSNITTDTYPIILKICDSKKKAIHAETLMSGRKAPVYMAAVKKGTYYIYAEQLMLYKLKCNFKAVSEKSGSSKAKAKAISKNKTAQGLFFYGESSKKADWYKLTLPKAQKVKFTLGAKSNKWINIDIMSANKKLSYDESKVFYSDDTETFTTRKALPKGTYYIKIYRDDKNTSGAYSLKWK